MELRPGAMIPLMKDRDFKREAFGIQRVRLVRR